MSGQEGEMTMPDPKAPYKLTIKLDGAKPERIAEALTELRETGSIFDQTGSASATMIIESWQEGPLRSVVDAFEDWLYAHAQGLDVDVKLQRPGIRPETIAQRMREKHETPMDKEWQEFADTNGAEITGTVAGRRLHVVPRGDVFDDDEGE
jgi:aromatic ring-opening dioxygenase catalytic subunit (LigB family)